MENCTYPAENNASSGSPPASPRNPASLREDIPGLDKPNLKLITTAIQHAAEQRPGHP